VFEFTVFVFTEQEKSEKNQKISQFKELASKLPYDTSPASMAKRKELFDGFDVNGNGFLSLAEVDKGIR
jgi:hypothetical protein